MTPIVLQLLVHGRADTLPALFDSLLAQTDKVWKLMLLVNGATPLMRKEILHVLNQYDARLAIDVSHSEENLGFAGGHQKLFETHQAPYVLLVNDDVVLAPEYIEQLRTYLDVHPQVAAVSGVLVRPDGRVDSLGLLLHANGKVSNISEGEIDSSQMSEPFEVFGVAGTLPLLRCDAVVDASHDGRLFDPAFGSYKEDIELAFRLRLTGWKSVIVPAAMAVHHRTFRRSRLHRHVSFYAQAHSYRNHWWNLLAFYSMRDYLRHAWALVPFEFAKFAFLCLTHPRILPWTVSTTASHWQELMRKRRHFL
ncbi:glycosyltransferase family 2 protein [Candidatus Uhrbacteria bacterium]|nr:glycosyltransferase family 2 protein [Candidatus Uhrbacteria bacterium]